MQSCAWYALQDKDWSALLMKEDETIKGLLLIGMSYGYLDAQVVRLSARFERDLEHFRLYPLVEVRADVTLETWPKPTSVEASYSVGHGVLISSSEEQLVLDYTIQRTSGLRDSRFSVSWNKNPVSVVSQHTFTRVA